MAALRGPPNLNLPVDGRLPLRRLAALETSSDDGDPDFVAERVVDDRSEDDVGVLVSSTLNEIGRS